MGFSHADLAELRARLNAGKIRFGPRIQARERLQISYMGQPLLEQQKPIRPPKEKPAEELLSYDAQYQLRRW